MRANKQNVFDDFIAAAEWLVANGYTSPEQLAIRGGSNGGLLVGAALTQRPELFGAVVCAVPLLDMMRYHQFGCGQDLDQRVRLGRRPGAVPRAARLLAVPSRRARDAPTRRC